MRSLLSFCVCACTASGARVSINVHDELGTNVSTMAGRMTPFNGFFTSSRYEYDPLTRYGEEFSDKTPQLIVEWLHKAAELNPNALALRQPKMDAKGNLRSRSKTEKVPGGAYEYRDFTWSEYYEAVLEVAAAFRNMGLQPMDTVHIRGVNSPEWLITFLGCITAGGLPVGLYPTDSPDTVKFKAKDAGATFVVVGKVKDLAIYADFVDEIHTLKGIVYWDVNPEYPVTPKEELATKLAGKDRNFMRFEEMRALGRGATDDLAAVAQGFHSQKPGQAASVVYTSGTTGNPKGVMLSQDALTWAISTFAEKVFRKPGDICGTMVPGSSARKAPKTEGVAAANICKCDIGFGIVGDEEKCSSGERKFSPWDKQGCRCSNIPAGTTAEVSPSSDPHQRILSYLPLNHVAGQMLDIMFHLVWSSDAAGQSTALYFPAICFLKKTCFKELLVDVQPTMFLGVPAVWNGLKAKLEMATAGSLTKAVSRIAPSVILKGLGLGSVTVSLSGAGPISAPTLDFFYGYGLKILNVYGQSETCGMGTGWLNEYYSKYDFRSKFGSIGKPQGNRVDVVNPDAQGRGEIVIRGRNLMMGYLNNEKKSASTFNSEGWLMTGDQGKIDDEGFFFLTGRLKEIMKDLGGEMILPVQVEEGIKKACNKPLKTIINEVILVGDGEYFVSALLTLLEDKPEGIPNGNLVGYAKQIDAEATTVAQAKQSKLWSEELGACIAEYNRVAAKSQERVYRYYILPKDITPEDSPDMMTPTQKIKRTGVGDVFADQIKSCGGEKELTSRAILPCTAK